MLHLETKTAGYIRNQRPSSDRYHHHHHPHYHPIQLDHYIIIFVVLVSGFSFDPSPALHVVTVDHLRPFLFEIQSPVHIVSEYQ